MSRDLTRPQVLQGLRSLKESFIDNIIVYVDELAYALELLEPMRRSRKSRGPSRWIVVGCAPRVTHHASKWATNSARESWRGKWADKLFVHLIPLFQHDGDTVVTRLAKSGSLVSQTEALVKEYGVATVLDGRRPKIGQSLQPISATPEQGNHGFSDPGTGIADARILMTAD